MSYDEATTDNQLSLDGMSQADDTTDNPEQRQDILIYIHYILHALTHSVLFIQSVLHSFANKCLFVINTQGYRCWKW